MLTDAINTMIHSRINISIETIGLGSSSCHERISMQRCSNKSSLLKSISKSNHKSTKPLHNPIDTCSLSSSSDSTSDSTITASFHRFTNSKGKSNIEEETNSNIHNPCRKARRSCLKGSRASSELKMNRSINIELNNKHNSLNQENTLNTKKVTRSVHFNHHVRKNLRSLLKIKICDETNNQIFVIPSLLEYSNDIWWSKSELKEFRDGRISSEVIINDVNPLISFLNIHQRLRQQFNEVCSTKTKANRNNHNNKNVQNQNDNNNREESLKIETLSFQSISKEDCSRLIYHLQHYDVHGLEFHIGENSIQRHTHIRIYVKRIITYYKMIMKEKKENHNNNIQKDDSSPNNYSNSNNNNVTQRIRKYSELYSREDSCWARFMGDAIHKTIQIKKIRKKKK